MPRQLDRFIEPKTTNQSWVGLKYGARLCGVSDEAVLRAITIRKLRYVELNGKTAVELNELRALFPKQS